MVWWLIPLAIATAGFVWIAASHPGKGTITAAIVFYLMLVLGWSIGFIQWAKARSVVVDLRKLSRLEALEAMLGKDHPRSGGK